MFLWQLLPHPSGCCGFRHHAHSQGGRREEEKWPQTYWFNQKANIPRNPPSRLPFILHWHHSPPWRGRLGNQHSEEDEGCTMFGWDQLPVYCLGLGRHGNIITGRVGGVPDEWAQPGWGLCTPHLYPLASFPNDPCVLVTKGRALFSFGFLTQVKWGLFLCPWAPHLSPLLPATDRLLRVILLSPLPLGWKRTWFLKAKNSLADFWSVILKSSHLSRF